MDFRLTKEQELIQKTARDFAEKKIAPLIFQIDQEDRVPPEIFQEIADLELAGIHAPEEYGGGGADYISYSLAVEQISRFSSGVAMLITSNNLAANCLKLFGTVEQKEKWLTDCARFKKYSSFAFTEPGTGTDPKMITTTAVRDGDDYIINGTKRFITGAGLPGPVIIFANDDETGYPTGFIVDKFCPGYSISEPWDKIGMRGGHTYDIYLKDVRVPAGNLLGEKGKGYLILLQNIAFGKLSISSVALGRAQAALEESIKYAKEKTQRNRPIAEFPTMQTRLATMAAKVEAARWLTYRLAFLAQTMTDRFKLAQEAAMTRQYVTEASMDVVRHAMQVHGSYGVMKGYKVEILYRDAIIGEILEGVEDVQKTIVGKGLIS